MKSKLIKKLMNLMINESIHYLTLSSNLNNSIAQFLLGAIYYYGQYIIILYVLLGAIYYLNIF